MQDPSFHELLLMFPKYTLNPTKFDGAEAVVDGDTDGLKPEFGCLSIAIDVHMERLVGLVAPRVDAIWAASQQRRHGGGHSESGAPMGVLPAEDPEGVRIEATGGGLE